MDQSALVERQIDDGEQIVKSLRSRGFDVAAAWWMRSTEDGLWFLYIASKEVDLNGFRESYGKVMRTMHELGPLWVDRFEIKLVSPDDPVAKSVLDILSRYPDRTPTRFGGAKLGNVSIDGSYIYPLPAAA